MLTFLFWDELGFGPCGSLQGPCLKSELCDDKLLSDAAAHSATQPHMVYGVLLTESSLERELQMIKCLDTLARSEPPPCIPEITCSCDVKDDMCENKWAHTSVSLFCQHG